MERILLVSANREHFPEPVFPLGAAYVASALVSAKRSVRIFDAGLYRFPLHALRREIQSFRPAAVGMSLRNVDNAAFPCTRFYVPGYVRIADTIRRSSSSPLFLGGAAFAIFPGQLLECLGADAGATGDGEAGIGGLFERREKGVFRAELPDPAEIGIPRTIGTIFPQFRKYRTLGIQTARGCPHRCVYCTYPLIEGTQLRTRPAGAVVDDMEFLFSTYGKRDYFIVDSSFNADETHMSQVCERIIARGLPIRFSCYLQPKMSDLSLFRLLAGAGCVAVDFGTDSCSEPVLRSLRKSFTADDVRASSQACRHAGIDFCHSLIFGGPAESPSTLSETVRVMDEIRPKAVVAMTGVRIYPGTEMERLAIREGLIASGESLLAPRFYFPGKDPQWLISMTNKSASTRRNWFLPGKREWSSAPGPRLLRLVHRNGPLWRTFRNT